MSMSPRPEFHDERSTRPSLPPLKPVLLAIVVVLTIVFFLQNGHTADVQFLWLDFSWPMRWVILISIAIGVALDRLGSFVWRRARERRRVRE